MKRKVVNSGRLRLSPNEEALVLKEDYERRRKLRLLQVREQERGIAFQIREDIKRRRNQQIARLAEELRAEWAESQAQKIKKLEKLYLASLRTMGEGHQQAAENEPDLNALEQRASERKIKAEIRHKEALKVQKDQKEQLLKQKTWHLQARKDALLVEKERSARVTRLPPPPPSLFENINLSQILPVRPSRASCHHLSSLVNREMEAEQPDPHVAAEEEAKRLEDAERQASQERAERCEKAHIRGSRALARIRLAQNQEKLLRELQQLQQEDRARRRQMVTQMPAELGELPYRRSEMKEEWQRELEFAFEDMYNADKQVEGDLVLHLEPEPPPAVADQIRDEDLDLSMEQELPGEATSPAAVDMDPPSAGDADVKAQQVPSKLLFKKLLSKIRNQKSLWTTQSACEGESSLPTCAEGSSSSTQAPTAETEASAATQSEAPTTTDSEPLTVENPPPCEATPGEEAGVPEMHPVPAMDTESVLLHPQEAAARVRMAARRQQILELEEQKQKQLELLEQIEQQKFRLESDRIRAQLEEEKRMETQQAEGASTSMPITRAAGDIHKQTIRSYQRHLLRQNRLHRQSVQTARKQLLEFQSALRGTHLPVARTSPHLGPGVADLAPEPWGAGLCRGLQAGDSAQTVSLESRSQAAPRAASTDMPSTSELSLQTSQATVLPRGPDTDSTGPPIPHRALSHHMLPVSRSTSGDVSARLMQASSLTCSSLPAASVSSGQGMTLPSSDVVATQRDLLQLLREQLDIQREVLRCRQEAQARLQSGQLGTCFLPPCLPLGLSAPARMESSSLHSDPELFSVHPAGPQPQATVSSSLQSVQVPGQEVPLSCKQQARVEHVQPETADPLSQHPLALLTPVDTLSSEPWEPSLSSLSALHDPAQPQAGPVSVLHQFLPLHNCLKLLQAQLATQWEALEARHFAQAQLLARRSWDPGHSSAGHGGSWLPPTATAQVPDLCPPTQESHLLPPDLRDESILPQQELCPAPHQQTHTLHRNVGAQSETQESAQWSSEAGPSCTLSQVMASKGPQERVPVPFSHATAPQFQEELERCSPHVLPARDSVKGSQETLVAEDIPFQGHSTQEGLRPEPTGPLTTGLRQPQEPPAEQGPGHLQARLQRLSQLLQPQHGQLQKLQERLAAQRAALSSRRQMVPEDGVLPRVPPAASPSAQLLPTDHSGLAALQQQLDSQKKALRAQQAAQEGLLLQRLQELEQRVCAPWAAGAESGPSSVPACSLLGAPGLTAPQGTRPHDLLSSRPSEPIPATAVPCPHLPLAVAEVGSTDTSDAGQLQGLQREAQEERQGQEQEQRPRVAPQEPVGAGPTRVPPECAAVLDAAAEGQQLVKTLPCPSLPSPAPVVLAPGTVVSSLPEPLHRAVTRRPTKPPVARVRSGLELQQHELSLIQEGESPAPSDFHQDRDPLRVSISREQNFLGDSPSRPASAPPPLSRGAATDEAVQETEQPSAVLRRTTGAAQSRLFGPAVEPVKTDVQEIYREPLSITLSTGSFLSFENTDLSLTDSESFSENVGPSLLAETEACVFSSAPLSACPRPDPLDMAVLVLQRADAQQEDSSSTARTPALHEPELTFPDLRPQQFKPLEPHLDFDVSSLSSGLNLSQASECSRGSRSSLPSPTSSGSSPSLRACPHPHLTAASAWPPVPAPTHTTAPRLSNLSEGSESAFLQLLPELSSQESQQADLPSILSIEAGDCSELLGHQDSLEWSEQSLKRSVQFPMGVPSLAMQSPSEACGFCRSLLPPSEGLSGSQLSSINSELSVEQPRTEEAGPFTPPASVLAGSRSAQAETMTRQAGPELSVSSGSFSSRSQIPIWETESGRGIMEEPDLTLVSLSDSSTMEMDFSTLTLEEKENEAQNSFRARSHPHTVGHSTGEPAAGTPQLTDLPGSLQEAFVERNQSFTERSSQRQELQTQGSGSCLKGMRRVQASLEDKRPFTHQRALRLYNHTAEVKQQKEEKARQDAYARNRAKAKEFHKKTLEKLRAKNTC